MPQFNVDEDLAALVEKLAKPKPFENLTFNNALRRVLTDLCPIPKNTDFEDLDQMLARVIENKKNTPKKAPSPSAQQWVALVPELKNNRALTTWKAVCDHLKIDTGGDSARRRLKNWVSENKASWPEVPSIVGD